MKIKCIPVTQGKHTFFSFGVKASVLWSFCQINRRSEDKDEGYQRVLSPSRVRQLKNFIMAGNAVPGAVIISFDDAKFSNGEIEFKEKPDAAWILDGQHRSAAAHEAALEGYDIELAVIAFTGLDLQAQTDYFVTINREAKSVPSSLYIDLLKHLPKKKTEKEMLEERVADIARLLNQDPESVMFQRIVSTTKPDSSQLSLTNFARVLRPIISQTGILGTYALPRQQKIIENYVEGLKGAFPKAFSTNIFFRTLGFGAVFRAFPIVFSAALAQSKAFRVADAQKIFELVAHFDFENWSKMGSGSGAEKTAGDDLISELKRALESNEGSDQIMLD